MNFCSYLGTETTFQVYISHKIKCFILFEDIIWWGKEGKEERKEKERKNESYLLIHMNEEEKHLSGKENFSFRLLQDT